MNDNQKRAHDIAVAIMQKNVQPTTNDENLNEYLSSYFNLYMSIFRNIKLRLDDLAS